MQQTVALLMAIATAASAKHIGRVQLWNNTVCSGDQTRFAMANHECSHLNHHHNDEHSSGSIAFNALGIETYKPGRMDGLICKLEVYGECDCKGQPKSIPFPQITGNIKSCHPNVGIGLLPSNVGRSVKLVCDKIPKPPKTVTKSKYKQGWTTVSATYTLPIITAFETLPAVTKTSILPPLTEVYTATSTLPAVTYAATPETSYLTATLPPTTMFQDLISVATSTVTVTPEPTTYTDIITGTTISLAETTVLQTISAPPYRHHARDVTANKSAKSKTTSTGSISATVSFAADLTEDDYKSLMEKLSEQMADWVDDLESDMPDDSSDSSDDEE